MRSSALRLSFWRLFLLQEKVSKVSLAAAEDEKYGDDQDPNAVVVKKVAKAVVIHKDILPSPKSLWRFML